MRVTAAVLYDTKKPVVVEDVELLEPGPHEVLVRYVASGVCHSDLHHITGALLTRSPCIYGHEAAGVVEAVGPHVTSRPVGDHVLPHTCRRAAPAPGASSAGRPCATCATCRAT